MTPERHGPASCGLSLVGISYRTAPLAILEGLALSADEVTRLHEAACARPEFSHALVLSTCNRTELYGFEASATPMGQVLVEVLRSVVAANRIPSEQYLYIREGRDSLVHLCRVAAGLDSMILGETQILGQVKEAYALSRRHRPAPAACERLMQAVFAAAKRSRHETEIGKGAVSIASAAVHVATRTLSEDLSQHTIAVIGAGETGRLVLEHFHSHRPKRTIVVNRTFERAAALAATVEASAWPWDRLSEAMAESDVLACTVRSAEPIINAPLLERALARRAGRPLVVLDLGLPRNVAPNVHHADLLINDLDAFRQVVDDNLCRREKEVPHVEAIIAEEIAKLGVDRQAATIVAAPVGPLIAALRESVETIRQIEAARATAGMSPAERAAVERATAAVIAKLLHVTTTSIKQLARHEVDGRLLDLVWALVDKLKGGSSAF